MQGAAILFSLSEPYKVVRIEAPSIHDRPLTVLAVVPRYGAAKENLRSSISVPMDAKDLTEKIRLFSKNVIWAE